VIGFLTLIAVLTCSSSAGSASRLESYISASAIPSFCGKESLPFLRGYDFNDARLHAILVNLLDELLEASELIHSLHKHHQCQSLLPLDHARDMICSKMMTISSTGDCDRT